MKFLAKKFALVGVNAMMLSVMVGCVQPIKQALPSPSLINAEPISMEFSNEQGKNIFYFLGQSSNTNIILDDSVYLPSIGVYQINVKPSILFNRLIESNCLSYRKNGENTILVYKPENQQCSFTPLKEGELAKIPELQKTVTFDGKVQNNFMGDPLSFGRYLSKIRTATQTDIVMKDVISSYSYSYSKEKGKIQVKANDQPAYKVLQALSTANCFDIVQLQDKSLFLFAKPSSAKCQPVENGTVITVE